MLKFTVKTSGEHSQAEISRIIAKEFRRAMTEIVLFGETEVARNTPVGVTGHTRQGIAGVVLSPFQGAIGFQGPAAKYGEFVERGRRRGKFPPFDAITLWLRRTDKGKAFVASVKSEYGLKNNAAALKQATFLKARGIARRGTRGAFMFKKALPKIVKRIEPAFKNAIKRIEKVLA